MNLYLLLHLYQRVSIVVTNDVLVRRMVELQRISLASCLNTSSTLMHMDTKSPQEQQQLRGPQLGPIPAALVSNRLAEVATVASSPQAVVLMAVQLVVLQAAVAKVQATGMARAEATLGGPLHLGRSHKRQMQSSRQGEVSRDSRQTKLNQPAAGQQPTMGMCGTCLSGCQQRPWHCLRQPWGTSTCSMLARPIQPVLLLSCRYVDLLLI